MNRKAKLAILQDRIPKPDPIIPDKGDKGDTGSKGDPGKDGETKVVHLTKTEVIHKPGIKGDKGDPGIGKDGRGFTWRDGWARDTHYEPYDIVGFEGSSWIAIQAHESTLFNSPRGNSEIWDVFVERGTAGGIGGQGSQGNPGQNGAGVASGGTPGQVLAKNSNSDYDTHWVDQSAGGGAVDSVNGKIGTVILDASDVGADPSGSAATAQTNAEAYTDIETSRAETAETTLQTNITSEASSRSSADSTLQGNINSEASTRSSADTTLQGNITSEVNRATTAEGLLVPKTTTVNGHALSANVTVTKGDVGLGSVDNTSDASKPVSTAQQTAIDAKVENSVTSGHTTVAPSGDAVTTALALKANLASPAFTGNPTAPTQAANNNSTRLATTAYVDAAVSGVTPTTQRSYAYWVAG
jgi:hypothetical protein